MRGYHRTWLWFALLVGLSSAKDDDGCNGVGTTCECNALSLRCTSASEAMDALTKLRGSQSAFDSFSCTECSLATGLKLDIRASEVNVSRNQLTNIEAGSAAVHSLDVSHNRLSSLEFADDFVHLRKLYASNNRIKTLSRLRLPTLTVLDLSECGIRDLTSDAFRDLQELSVLKLDGNRLEHLRQEWFSGLRSLHHLSVSSNKVVQLNNLVFRPASRLHSIDLSHNRIARVGELSFEDLRSLSHLNVSFNNVTTLPAEFSKSLQSVEVLDVSGNPLRSLECFRSFSARNFSLVARKMPALKSISPNDTIGLEGVTRLDLSGSQLEVIEPHAFGRLERLEVLDLSECALTSLPKGLFLPLVLLRKVSLRGNAWHCDCGLRWLKSLLQRPELQLEEPNSTRCSTSDGARPGSPPGERLVYFLERSLPCVNATVTNYTRMAHFRLGTSAMLFCEVEGTPPPTLRWLSEEFGALDECDKSCFEGGPCRGCHLARWICRERGRGCDSDECRRSAQECLRLVDEEQADKRCCSPAHLWTAVETCFNGLVSGRLPCLQEVGAISAAKVDVQPLARCLSEKDDCVRKCSSGLCADDLRKNCFQPAVTCVLDAFAHESLEAAVDFEHCQSRICTRGNKLYISKVSRGDSGYYICRASNVLQTQQATILVTLDYSFFRDIRNYSILTGFGVAVLFTVATLIGVAVEKILEHFGLKCPCDAGGPVRRQNIVKILEQVEGYRRQNLERLRENYNWQVARIKENCILQMDRVKDSYIAEQTGKIRDYGSSQIWAMKDNYLGQVQRVRDYGNGQMDWLRENYVFQRNRIHKFSKHQLIRLRENYKLQQKHLNKILETLPNLESCRRGFYSETDLTELNFTAMLLPPPPPIESVLEFAAFDEFSLPDIQTGFDSLSGTILTPDAGSLRSLQSERKSRKAYRTIEDVIQERLLPLEGIGIRPSANEAKKRGHRRSSSAPVADFRGSPKNLTSHPPPLPEALKEEQRSSERSASMNTDSRTEGSRSTGREADVLVGVGL